MHSWWKYNWYNHYETLWWLLKKLKTELLYNPVILPLHIYPKTMKTLNPKIYMLPHVHCSIFWATPCSLQDLNSPTRD